MLEGSAKVLIRTFKPLLHKHVLTWRKNTYSTYNLEKEAKNGIPSSTRANRQVIGRQHWKSPCPLFRPPVRSLLFVFTVDKKKSNAVRCGRGGAAALPWLQGEWNLWPCKGKGGVFFSFFFSFSFFGASLYWGFLDLSRVLGCSSDSP